MPRRLVIGKTSEEIIKCHIGKDVEPPYSYYTVLQAEVLSVDSNNIKSLCLIGCMHSTMIYCQFLAGCLSLNGGWLRIEACRSLANEFWCFLKIYFYTVGSFSGKRNMKIEAVVYHWLLACWIPPSQSSSKSLIDMNCFVFIPKVCFCSYNRIVCLKGW